MHEVKRSALVLASPGQMAALVRDVERYPDFLSWCTEAKIHEQTETLQLASLGVKIGGIRQSFSTRNYLDRNRRVVLELAEGPFQEFGGQWTFAPVGEGCQVELDLRFHFGNPLLAATFKRGFEHMADRLVSDFCKRAEALHGA